MKRFIDVEMILRDAPLDDLIELTRRKAIQENNKVVASLLHMIYECKKQNMLMSMWTDFYGTLNRMTKSIQAKGKF